MEEIDVFMNSKVVELNQLTVQVGGDNNKGEMVKN
jgi:hypothetical protein